VLGLTMPEVPTPTHLALRDASRHFGSVHAVDRVSLELRPGSFTALVGPSGCGKTTILRLLAGIDLPDSGVCAREPGSAAVGFLFQEPRLLAWRTVRENVALPLELLGVARADRFIRTDAALEMTQLADAADRFPHQLSGGMKMRASLARALVTRPTQLFLDEPFGALDEVTRHELDMELRALWERERFTAVLVTHSLPEAAFLAERMVVFSPRPARVVADLKTPTGTRDARFWTSDPLGACVRCGSEAMLRAIEEARR
jgi:NitT/TauT family transport system ATP-binding protein